jgi:phage virion morphogenesis protein
MAGASITITDTATPAVSRLIAVSARPSAMMRDIGGYLLFSTQRRFETETGPDGVKWPALSPRTAKARAGRGKVRGTDHILRQSVRLYNSLTMASDDTTAQVGTNVEYAAIHQFGGPIQMPERQGRVTFKKIRGKRGVRFVKAGTAKATVQDVSIKAHTINMPARPYLGINGADQEEIGLVSINALRREADL